MKTSIRMAVICSRSVCTVQYSSVLRPAQLWVWTLSPSQEILNYINRKEFEPLLKVDQLNLEREKNKVFLRFGTLDVHISTCCFKCSFSLGYLNVHLRSAFPFPTASFPVCVCVCVQRRRRSPIRPRTVMSAARETRTSGRSRRRLGYVRNCTKLS